MIDRRHDIPGRRSLAVGVAALFASLLLAAPASAAFGSIAKWGGPTPGNADGQFNEPSGVATDAAGNVYVADSTNHRIQVFAPNGTFITKWGSLGSAEGQFAFPDDVAVDPAGNVYVADSGRHRIQKFTSDGTFLRMYGRGVNTGAATFETCVSDCEAGTAGTGDGEFNNPNGVATDAAGNVYVSDLFNHRIQKFDPDNVPLGTWGSQGPGAGELESPDDVAIDPAGNVYVAETSNQRISKFTSDGTFVSMFGWRVDTGNDQFETCITTCQAGLAGPGDGQLSSPRGVAADADGNVYVSESGNDRIQVFSPTPAFLWMFGWGVDTGAPAFEICTSGCQAGDPGPGSGDGQLINPMGVTTDCRGNVYVADFDNDRIQKFGDTAAPPPPCVTSTPPGPEPGPEPEPKSGRTLSFEVSKPKVVKGKKVGASGQLESGNVPACEASQTVEILRDGVKRGSPQVVATLTTDAQGRFATKLKMRKTSLLSARAPETAGCLATTSGSEKVRVKKKK